LAPVLQGDEIRRFLRLGRSSAMKGDRRVPITAIGARTGISRKHLYAITRGVPGMSADCWRLLTPLIRNIESGKIAFRRTSLDGDERNQWTTVER
jgi:hypothetical protein